MECIKLSNGSEESLDIVTTIMMSLEKLMKVNPLAFYDLVMKCRIENHQFSGKNGEYLRDQRLIQDLQGTINSSIKNVVLSAVKGDGFRMVLDSPLAE